MSTLRQALYGVALLAALGLLIWAQEGRVTTAEARLETAQNTAQEAGARAGRSDARASALNQALSSERTAQAKLRTEQSALRLALAQRQSTIEDLKRENEQYRTWAAGLLPDAARGLYERPAITGAAGYRDWLSGRGAVRPAPGGATQ